MRRFRPATSDARTKVGSALEHLRIARDLLRKADCPRALEKIALPSGAPTAPVAMPTIAAERLREPAIVPLKPGVDASRAVAGWAPLQNFFVQVFRPNEDGEDEAFL